ncbi:hypothetical protein GOP47_0024311 [Adiantum capillus-veneris]|uniref:DUF4371 domain-containing protein n=1 Tax=Adiantum capillus-veneris TaxID=13818 RepID=A0A9D4Z4W9_ADICA|nr:hypothetical protein GOP47_0024311 [Adiantum capillus-veneris]
MQENGNGSICTSFVDLLHVKNAEAESLYSTLIAFLVKMKLSLHKMIGIATDGASVMIGANNGVVSRLKKVVLHLLSFHCVAHRESLACVGLALPILVKVKFESDRGDDGMIRMRCVRAIVQRVRYGKRRGRQT